MKSVDFQAWGVKTKHGFPVHMIIAFSVVEKFNRTLNVIIGMVNKMIEYCPLCHAVNDTVKASGVRQLENTLLGESDSFVLLPCVGPLVPGQALIVSRQHFHSLAAMSSPAIQEYDEFVSWLLKGESGWLEAEHGATDDDYAGGCVTHAHIHLIPGMSEFAEVFDGYINEIYRGEEFHLPAPTVPYAFLRGDDRQTRLFSASGLPSQVLRQTICSAMHRDDWDWRALPRHHLIAETLEFWRRRG